MIPLVLVSDFFAWLWYLSEESSMYELPDGSFVDVIVDEQISFRIPNDDADVRKANFKGKISDDARKSFAMGGSIEAMRLVLRKELEDRAYEIRFARGGMSSFKVALPMEGGQGDVATGVHENMLLLGDAEKILDQLFAEFLDLRVNHSEELLAKISTLTLPKKAGGAEEGGWDGATERED